MIHDASMFAYAGLSGNKGVEELKVLRFHPANLRFYNTYMKIGECVREIVIKCRFDIKELHEVETVKGRYTRITHSCKVPHAL